MDLLSLGIEVFKTLLLLLITGFLIWTGRGENGRKSGRKQIQIAFFLLTFAALLALTDEFDGLEQDLLNGGTATQLFIIKSLYSVGYLVLLLGLLKWIPPQNHVSEQLLPEANERTAALQKTQQFIRAVVQQSHDLVVACDIDGRIILSNDRNVAPLIGAKIGLTLQEWHALSPQYDGYQVSLLTLQQLPLYRALQGEVVTQQEVVLKNQGQNSLILLTRGCPIYDNTGKQQGAMISAYDITAQKQLEEQLTHQAQHDSLTGLANRFLFNDRLNQTALRIQRYDVQAAVIMLDLDKFKEVNDSLGHAAGDQLLEQVSQRMKAALRDSDTIARLGGDEFAIILELSEGTAKDDTQMVAGRLLEHISQPFLLNDQVVQIGASIGIACSLDSGGNADTLLRNADAALYQAKAEGRNRFYCYNTKRNQQAVPYVQSETVISHPLYLKEV
ncbi:diguanylate cyclase domain-containing protein [Psychromonas sp.]|uniref:diguanylate cyclase domain-containing protein n=1 Tax=Psychromonas sp. TaxID=1884585 RepID=UPI0035632AA1